MAAETLMLTIVLAGLLSAKLMLLAADYAPVWAARRRAALIREPGPGAGFARTS